MYMYVFMLVSGKSQDEAFKITKYSLESIQRIIFLIVLIHVLPLRSMYMYVGALVRVIGINKS